MINFEGDLGPHYLYTDFSDGFLNVFDRPVVVGLPHPIHKPITDKNIDKVTKFHEVQATYDANFSLVASDVKSGRYSAKTPHKGCYGTTTKGILDLYSDMIKQPKVPYQSDYNPYFSTGLLSSIQYDSEPFLLTADAKCNIRVSNLFKHWHSQTFNVENRISEPILGISTTPMSDGVFVLVRHKKTLNLLQLKEDSEFVVSKWEQQYKHSILDAHFNQNTNKIGYIDDNLNIFLCDLQKDTLFDISDEFDLEKSIKFEYLDDKTIGVLSQNSLSILDSQSNGISNEYKLDKTKCNHFCAFKVDKNVIYISTKHHLLRMDMRMLKEPEYCTHLMKSTPCYVDFTENCLCLASQTGEKCIFVGSPINSLPIEVPSLNDSLQEFRLERDLFTSIPQIERRIAKSTTGVQLVLQKDHISLYSSSYLGDLFKQTLYFDLEPVDETESSECFNKWAKELGNSDEGLRLSDAANLAPIRFTLNRSLAEGKIQKLTVQSKKTDKCVQSLSRIYCKKNYGDLGENFASIWDEDDEEMPLAPEVEPFEKVDTWIQSNLL